MPIDLGALGPRLNAVDPVLISPEVIQTARRKGASCLREDPAHLIQLAQKQSRHNPVLGTAFGLGCVEAAERQTGGDALPAAYGALGIGLSLWGYYAEGHDCLEVALAGLDDELALLYCEWHDVLCRRRVFSTAGSPEAFVRIAQRLESLGDISGAYRCRLNWTNGLLAQMRYDENLRIQREARAFFRKENNKVDEGFALAIKAYTLSLMGEFEEAAACIDEAEMILTEIDAPVMLGYVWMLRGLTYEQQSEPALASHWFDLSYKRHAAVHHPYYQVVTLMRHAGMLFTQGDVNAGIEKQRAASLLAEKSSYAFMAADGWLLLANTYYRQGYYALAADEYRRACRLYEVTGQTDNYAICTMNLGVVARRRGKFSEALQMLLAARELFEESGLFQNLVILYHNLGLTYAAFGYFEPAATYLHKCLDVAAEHHVPSQAVQPAISLAKLLAVQGKTAQAYPLLEEASRKARAAGMDFDLALCSHVQAEALYQDNRHEEALAAYRDSVARFEALHQLDAAHDPHLGMVQAHLALEEVTQAREMLDALSLASLPQKLHWRYHALAARAARQQGKIASSRESYLSAMKSIRATRGNLDSEEHVERYLLSLQTVYDEAFEVAIEQEDAILGISVAELQGALLLSARLGVPFSLGMDVAQIREAFYEQTASKLGEDWTALRYYWHKDALWVFVVTPEGEEWQPVPLTAEVKLALRMCASPDDSFRRAAYLAPAARGGNGRSYLHALSEALIPAKARARLHPEHTLIVVPSHRLHGVAFQALLVDDAPLINHTQVLYAQSLEMLRSQLTLLSDRWQWTDSSGLLLVQSEFDKPGYADLPHVEREAEAIRQRAHRVDHLNPSGMRREELINDQRAAVMALYDWLHIATHTYYEPETGAFTGLLLGKDVITVKDLQQMKLRARLVTLSACQSGMGRWYYGDEIVGLAQTFLGVGVQSVVASLWLAADQPSADLMAEFYHAIESGNSPATALATAQREAAAAEIAPYHWATFSTFGLP